MTVGHEEILIERLMNDLDDDAVELARLPLPPEILAKIATRLNERRTAVWEINAIQKTAFYFARTGKLPRRAIREGVRHAA